MTSRSNPETPIVPVNNVLAANRGAHGNSRRSSSGLSRFFTNIADAGFELFSRKGKTDPQPVNKLANIRAECHELLSTLGEATGTALARKVLQAYLSLDVSEKYEFFVMLRQEFDIDKSEVRRIATTFVETDADSDLAALLALAEPPRQELFRRLNMAPDGTKALIEMRGSLLSMLSEHPDLRPVDQDFRHLFSSWFNRGFLQLKTIDWNSPAVVLEKLIENESVHEMQGWDDLRRRLADDRRCFAFFHSALPNEPLVFVEVALVRGLATEIAPIINGPVQDESTMPWDTAIFYSINNCLKGLVGVSFGNFLIKQVVIELQRDCPELTVFSTLSPVPRFRRWLEAMLTKNTSELGLNEDEIDAIKAVAAIDWEQATHLESVLTHCIAYYLTHAKRNIYPLDPVARFHLRNGARLDRINWMGDTSAERIQESYGFLVNYVYESADIVGNHENYIKNATVVTSDEVIRQAKQKGVLE